MATADEIISNGQIVHMPSLSVAKSMAKMSGGPNLDWLLHVYYARRDFGRCKRIIEHQLYRQLNPEYLYFIKGLIDRDEGNNIDAQRNLQKALDMNGSNIETYKELGKTLFAMGRFSQALAVFREAEHLSPRDDYEIFHYIGELLYRSCHGHRDAGEAGQKESDAKAYFKRAVQCGKKLDSFVRLAEIHRKDKEYHKAIAILEGALQLSPENTAVLTEIGVLHLKINETEKAFDRLQEVINVDGHCSRGLLALGAILQSRNDCDAALGKYKEIAATEPEIAELWNNIGLCFYKKQKLIAAISSLRKSIWLSPLNYNALYNMSLVYISAEQYASAFHTLAAAINLRKDSSECYMLLGTEQYASAFHTLAAAINLRKDSSECYMLLGICLRKLDDTENAYTAFERSSALQRLDQGARNPLVYLNFALFCYECGRTARATEEYNRFLSDSHNLLLPTEFKFQATKLKSLLKITSATNILYSPAASPASGRMENARSMAAIATAEVTTSSSRQYLDDEPKGLLAGGESMPATHHHLSTLSLPTPSSGGQRLPLEVNAVVRSTDHLDGAGGSGLATQWGGRAPKDKKKKRKIKSKLSSVISAILP